MSDTVVETLGAFVAREAPDKHIHHAFYDINLSNNGIISAADDFCKETDEEPTESLPMLLKKMRTKEQCGFTISDVLFHGPKVAALDIGIESASGEAGEFYARNEDDLINIMTTTSYIHGLIGAQLYKEVSSYHPALNWFGLD